MKGSLRLMSPALAIGLRAAAGNAVSPARLQRRSARLRAASVCGAPPRRGDMRCGGAARRGARREPGLKPNSERQRATRARTAAARRDAPAARARCRDARARARAAAGACQRARSSPEQHRTASRPMQGHALQLQLIIGRRVRIEVQVVIVRRQRDAGQRRGERLRRQVHRSAAERLRANSRRRTSAPAPFNPRAPRTRAAGAQRARAWRILTSASSESRCSSSSLRA